jgi:hypothetical protein
LIETPSCGAFHENSPWITSRRRTTAPQQSRDLDYTLGFAIGGRQPAIQVTVQMRRSGASTADR